MSKNNLTNHEFIRAAVSGIVRVDTWEDKGKRVKTIVSRVYEENSNEYKLAITVNGTYVAFVMPDRGEAQVVAKDALTHYGIAAGIRMIFHDCGYVDMGMEAVHHALGRSTVWKRRPRMYMITTDEEYPASVDGKYRYDPEGIAWSYLCTALLPGDNGHQCTDFIPKEREGYAVWEVDYAGAHSCDVFGKIGTIHTFGTVRLVHRVDAR